MKRHTLFLCVILTALLALPGASPAADEDTGPKLEDTPKLSVRGEAQVEIPADRLTLSIGVVTENAEATRALEQNSRQMSKVIAALEHAGLTEEEYETGRFRLRPTYSRRPRQPEPDWQPQITGYEIVNSITIKTKQIELAGKLIEAANKAGANTIDSVGFDLSDERAGRGDAIAKATRNAIADARTLADAASLQLVRIITVRLDEAEQEAARVDYNRPMGAAGGSTPPISPGKVAVKANVTIVYEIAPAAQGN